MAGKITIRRKGGFFPTLCLIVLLLAVVLVGWLSLLGLPEALLRRVERMAAQQGVYLHVDSVRLQPFQGLAIKAEGLKLFADETQGRTLAELEGALVELSVSRLVAGDVWPREFALTKATLRLPVTAEEGAVLPFHISELEAKLSRRGMLNLTIADCDLDGASIRARGGVDLSPYITPPVAAEEEAGNTETEQEEGESAAPGPLDLPSLLAPAQPYINEAYRVIHSQNWTPQEKPAVDVEFSIGESAMAALRINLPRYDVEHFHFRQGEAAMNFMADTLVIHELHFKTVEPNATVRLQGGYNINSRQLSFNMDSNAALIRMAERLVQDETVRALLGKIRHKDEDAPDIRLRGDVNFTEDYALQSINLQGNLSQQRLSIGSSLVEDVELSFLYRNGDFHIQKFALTLPEGTLGLTASLRDGKGAASIAADIDVSKLLTLVSEFTAEPVILPDGLTLQGHTRLAFEAELSAPPFVPGQTAWQDFVPDISDISFHVDVDEASYGDLELKLPYIRAYAKGIEQGADELPCAMQELGLIVRLNQARWQAGPDTAPVELQKTQLELDLNGLVLHNSTEGGPDLSVQQGDFKLNAAALSQPPVGLESISLILHTDKGIRWPAEPTEILRECELKLDVGGIRHEEQSIGGARIVASMVEERANQLQLHAQVTNTDGKTLSIQATPNWTSDLAKASLQDAALDLPLAAFSTILEHFGITTDAVELPESMTLNGSLSYDIKGGRLTESKWHVSIPELVRTPSHVKVFEGEKVGIGVEADVYLHTPPNGVLNFDADLEVTQATGRFKGNIRGDADGHLHITGENTIRADMVDRLIDLNDAHSIIRDFRFTDATKTSVTDIDVKVDLSDPAGGVRVHSYCKADLRNAAYMLCGMERLADGRERPRQDLGKDPFTYCKHASCSVTVEVVMSCVDEKGGKIPDVCTITLGNALLEYDNAPWFKRQGFTGKIPETSLTGDSIVIDIENSFVEINKIRGTAYPAYSLGMFYASLQHFMEDILLPSPAFMETERCAFPIYHDCKRPMSGTIHAECAPLGYFRFLGTKFPLYDFSGYIYLTDDYVQLDRLNAVCWEGVIDANIIIGIKGDRTDFDGLVTASAMNLEAIARSYDSEQKPATCNGGIRFRSASPDLQDLQAYGFVNIADGDLLFMNLFQPVSVLLSDIPGYLGTLEDQANLLMGRTKKPKNETKAKYFGNPVQAVGKTIDTGFHFLPFANHILTYNLTDAYTEFSIEKGHLLTTGMKATGSNLTVKGNFDLDIDKVYLRGDLWPSISNISSALLMPINFLSHYLIDINIFGPLDKLQWGIGLTPLSNFHHPTAPKEEEEKNRKEEE